MTFAQSDTETAEVEDMHRPVDAQLRERIKLMRLRDVEAQIRSILGHGGYQQTEVDAIVSAAIFLLRNDEKVSAETLYRRMRSNGVADDDARMMSRDFAH